MSITKVNVKGFSKIEDWKVLVSSYKFQHVLDGREPIGALCDYVDLSQKPSLDILNQDERAWLQQLVSDSRKRTVNKVLNMLEYFEVLGISKLRFGIPRFIFTYPSLSDDRELFFTDGIVAKEGIPVSGAPLVRREIDCCNWIVRARIDGPSSEISTIINTFAINKAEYPISIGTPPMYFDYGSGNVKMLLRNSTK